jgi:hypothetical protein
MNQPSPGSTSRHTQDRSRAIRIGRNSTEQAKVITQDLLATLRRRKAQMEKSKRDYDETRQSILDLDEAGAKPEPGPLEFSVTPSEQCRFTAENLTAILGEDEVEELQTRIPWTPMRTLRVFESRRR